MFTNFSIFHFAALPAFVEAGDIRDSLEPSLRSKKYSFHLLVLCSGYSTVNLAHVSFVSGYFGLFEI